MRVLARRFRGLEREAPVRRGPRWANPPTKLPIAGPRGATPSSFEPAEQRKPNRPRCYPMAHRGPSTKAWLF